MDPDFYLIAMNQIIIAIIGSGALTALITKQYGRAPTDLTARSSPLISGANPVQKV